MRTREPPPPDGLLSEVQAAMLLGIGYTHRVADLATLRLIKSVKYERHGKTKKLVRTAYDAQSVFNYALGALDAAAPGVLRLSSGRRARIDESLPSIRKVKVSPPGETSLAERREIADYEIGRLREAIAIWEQWVATGPVYAGVGRRWGRQ